MAGLRYVLHNPDAPGSRHYPIGYFFPENGDWAIGPVRWDGKGPLTGVYVGNAPLVNAGGKLSLSGKQLARAIIYPLSEEMRMWGETSSASPAAIIEVHDSVVQNIGDVVRRLHGANESAAMVAGMLAGEINMGIAERLADSCAQH